MPALNGGHASVVALGLLKAGVSADAPDMQTAIDKIAVVVPPVAAFVAAGFEHCIANIYFIPLGLFIKAGAPESFWSALGKAPTDFPALTWENFVVANLLPVTLGNVLGGSVLVGLAYWFIYLRGSLR